MPTPVGPSVLSVSFHLVAIRSKAWSQLTGTKSPFLSYLPSFWRISGVVRRSLPYMILDRK